MLDVTDKDTFHFLSNMQINRNKNEEISSWKCQQETAILKS